MFQKEKQVAEMWLHTIPENSLEGLWKTKDHDGKTSLHHLVEFDGDKSITELWLNTIDKTIIEKMWDCADQMKCLCTLTCKKKTCLKSVSTHFIIIIIKKSGNTPAHFLVKFQDNEELLDLFLGRIPAYAIIKLFQKKNDRLLTPLESHAKKSNDAELMKRYKHMLDWLLNKNKSQSEEEKEKDNNWKTFKKRQVSRHQKMIHEDEDERKDARPEETPDELDALVKTWLQEENNTKKKKEKTTHRYWFREMLKWYQQCDNNKK
ncbi:hypothetical protein RFI_21318 [Reticulomyxa filosa]|uniref:Uncharacterized protein n=1 Tax=Reticulomyxa filosa TaxID=46433 RepID=X6MRH0_RETFI|nr:hypothetical protein RFI_21318 [Reticulomyxa filosa]|eukprot:ETO16042.1 hypothetical protein RFI_21318 [Reticulomyxa filosa]